MFFAFICVFSFVLLRDKQNVSLGVFDRCQILFIRPPPPLLIFVRLLAALITNVLDSF
jgi:hypothetical protein